MATLSPRVTASAMRSAASFMAVSTCGSGMACLMVGSRKAATASASILRPARMRAKSSGSSCRCAISSARTAPRSSSRSRQARPVAEFSTPRNKRVSVMNVIVPLSCPRAGGASSTRRRVGPNPIAVITGSPVSAGDDRRGLFELIKLAMLGPDPADGAACRAHHHRFSLDHILAEQYPAQHAAVGDTGRGEQAIAPHHILDPVCLARVLDAHFGDAFALFVGIDDQPGLHLAADAFERRRRQNAFRRTADAEIDVD